MTIRRLTAAAAALLATAVLAGCGQGSQNAAAINKDGSVDLSKVTLTVGDQKAGSKALLQAAGELRGVKYKIKWREFTSGPPLLEALNAGAIDVGGVGNTPPLFAAAAKSRIKVVQGATYGGQGDAIVVPKGSTIQSVADLKGKRIAVAKGSSANYHLLAQLQKAGLGFDDVTVDYLQPADALAALSSDHLDAWATWEPFTSQAVLDEGARVLVDGKDLVNGYTFQVASDKTLEDKATTAALKDYLARVARSQVWSDTHKQDWADVWATETGLSQQVTTSALDKRQVALVPIDGKVVDSEQEMADTFATNKLVPAKFDVQPYFSEQFNAATTGR